eukprot:10241274-Karenia_brevis.AAC.1
MATGQAVDTQAPNVGMCEGDAKGMADVHDADEEWVGGNKGTAIEPYVNDDVGSAGKGPDL